MEYSFYKLSKGSDVFNSLKELQTDNYSRSFLISAVGDLSFVSLKCTLNEKPIILEKKLEVITLSGYLTSKESHVHISVSDENCSVFGGHLLPGSTVLKSLEILLGVIPDPVLKSIGNKNDNSVSVDIFVLPDCPWSKRAIKLLDSYAIKYNYHLITNDDEFRKISFRTSINIFPQIFINNEFVGGYTELAKLSSQGNLIKLIQ